MNDFNPAPNQDVAVLSRIRLARNFEDIPFSPIISALEVDLLIGRAEAAIENCSARQMFRLERMSLLSPDERGELIDHFQISNDLLKYVDTAAVMLSEEKNLSIMIGEEDHLRIFSLLPGLQLEQSADLAYTADTWLEKSASYAFDAQFGYLTACPTNAGTGLRGSVLLHLPILRATGQIGRVIQEVSKLGLTLRGLYNDNNEADGNIYYLSNHASLGRAEEDVLRSLSTAATQIIRAERSVRENMLSQDELLITDRLCRSIGILRCARLINNKEWMQRWSDLRLSAVFGLLDASLSEIDHLMMDLQPSSLNSRVGKTLSERESSTLRADILRKKLSAMPDTFIEI